MVWVLFVMLFLFFFLSFCDVIINELLARWLRFICCACVYVYVFIYSYKEKTDYPCLVLSVDVDEVWLLRLITVGSLST